MHPNDIIDAYVREVVRRIPARQRNDVGFELRELLREMLADRAGGGSGDHATAIEMLREFGAPSDIAERYHSPGKAMIAPGQTRSFAILSLAGIALQWTLTFPHALGQPVAIWWLRWGLGALWWPGLLAMIALAAAWLGRIMPPQPTWTPRMIDAERINRPIWLVGLVCFAIAAVTMMALPSFVTRLPEPVRHVLAFDSRFLRERAPVIVLLWICELVLLGVVAAQGRWSRGTRRYNAALGSMFALVLIWWIAAGRIFQMPSTDSAAKSCIGLAVALIVLDLGFSLYRRGSHINPPKIVAG